MTPSPRNTVANTGEVFLDANILLEILLDRTRQASARQILQRYANGVLYISALTAHLVVHFGTSVTVLPILRQFLADYSILPLDAADFEWAFINTRTKDYEDALQLATAIRHGVSHFVTLDKSLYKTYQGLPGIKLELLS